MSRASTNYLTRLDDRLKRIANILFLNASFIDNHGLLNGKMGIAIFFYQYGRIKGIKLLEDFAGELIDEIYEEINSNTPCNFEDGLTGIGWGIEYLVRNGFAVANTDETLSELDDIVYSNSLYTPYLFENENSLFGYGLYFFARLQGREDNDLSTLFKKQHLIYLIDECERLLIKKQYLNFGVKSLSIDLINSIIWFLLEMFNLRLFPSKIEKLFNALPEYIEQCVQCSVDYSSKSFLINSLNNIIRITPNKNLQQNLLHITKYNKNTSSDKLKNDVVTEFITNSWQQLVYYSYSIENHNTLNEVFSIIDDELNWNERIINLNNKNQGLKGLAGLGLGLISLRIN